MRMRIPAPLPQIQSQGSHHPTTRNGCPSLRNGEIELVVMHEPTPGKWYEPNIAPEQEHPKTDQRCEPATMCDVLGVSVELERMERSPTHTPATEGEMLTTSENDCCDELAVEIYLDLPSPLGSSSSAWPLWHGSTSRSLGSTSSR